MNTQSSEALNALQNLTCHLFTRLTSDAEGRQFLRDFCETTLLHLQALQRVPEVKEGQIANFAGLPEKAPVHAELQNPTAPHLPAASTGEELESLKRQLEEKISRLQRGTASRFDWFAFHPQPTVVEGCLRNLHLALTLLEGHLDEFKVVPKNVLLLVAEAQSAVRALSSMDQEQNATFQLLREISSEQGMYLDRFMRLNQLAIPQHYAELRCRLENQLHANSPTAGRKKTKSPSGKPLSRPVLEGHVLEARQLVQGKTLLLVGGVMKPDHLQALQEGLECTVKWIPTQESSNFSEVAAQVGREQADVVLVLVRFVRHAVMMVKDTTENPVVMIRGGYSLSSVAHHIIEQASVRLSHFA